MRRVDKLKKTADFITIAPRTINNSSPKQRLIKCKEFTLNQSCILNGWGRIHSGATRMISRMLRVLKSLWYKSRSAISVWQSQTFDMPEPICQNFSANMQ